MNFYSANGILAEIEAINRFSNQGHLASYARPVPRAEHSGQKVGNGRPRLKGTCI